MDGSQTPLEEGYEHHRAGRLKEAHEVYKVVVAGEPENAAAHYLLGTLYMQGGDKKLAVDLLAK
ncbi:MAG: tetratricopeptide repeat protein, partial [Rhodospirillaceae bacterium]|nr:tetratricopeptide repeat protein [Rhodospirillaceae bacterium]